MVKRKTFKKRSFNTNKAASQYPVDTDISTVGLANFETKSKTLKSESEPGRDIIQAFPEEAIV